MKAGKAPGSCGVYPEYILHGGNEALKTLHSIFTRVWEDEVVPEEWHQHRRRLYVSGTGAEGAEKRRDVDGVEGWGVPGCPLANRLRGGLGSVVSTISGGIF